MIALIILEFAGPVVFMGTLNAIGLKITDLAFWLLVILYASKGAYFMVEDFRK